MVHNSLSKLLLSIVCSSFCLVSCSTYPSKFKCGDAKGLGCVMLSEIDKQINNGKIVEAYNCNNQERYNSKKRCAADYFQNQDDILRLRNSQGSAIYIKDFNSQNDDNFKEKDYRYVFE